MTSVISVRGHVAAELFADPAFRYIGRAMPYQGWIASLFGNPFKPGMTPEAALMAFLAIPAADRLEYPESEMDVTWSLLDCYEAYVRARRSLWERVAELKGLTLGCWCCSKPWTPADAGPLVCHGQILACLAEGIDTAKYQRPMQERLFS